MPCITTSIFHWKHWDGSYKPKVQSFIKKGLCLPSVTKILKKPVLEIESNIWGQHFTSSEGSRVKHNFHWNKGNRANFCLISHPHCSPPFLMVVCSQESPH